MKPNQTMNPTFQWAVCLSAILGLTGPVLSQEDGPKKSGAPEEGEVRVVSNVVLAETDMDRPAEFHEEFGMMPGSKLAKSLKRISKIDLDGDLNYDGSISNYDDTDGGLGESVPPGLQVGVGELTKIVVRFKTYENDYPGILFVKLDVAGIDRFAQNGKYASVEQEMQSTGRIRVWGDFDRKTLLVDSGDAGKRSFEWKVDKNELKSGLPGVIPRVLYIEGVEASKTFEGDVRLLMSSSHALSEGGGRLPSSIYHTAHDHLLLTVRDKPVKKGFVNNNVEGVWSTND